MRAASCVSLLTLAGAACAAPPSADLVVLAGQSNALGYGLSAADAPIELRAPDPRVRIWDGRRFVPMAPGRNTGSPNRPGTWGPEAGFARAWRAAHPDRTLYIVKLARGSTPLAQAPGRDWSPGSGELFEATAREVAHARAALNGAPVAAVLWVQGEADAADPAMAAAYRENLTALLAAVRERWTHAPTSVVLARIPAAGPHAAEVRAAQAAVDEADPLTTSVDAAGLPLQADGLHITAAGHLRLGEALALAALRPAT